MKYPSKKQAAMVSALEEKAIAIENNDATGFAKAIEKLAAAEAESHIYLCLSCGKEFPDGPHVDLLVASIVEYDKNGESKILEDYGITSVSRNSDAIGRRFKFCGGCVKKWKHHPKEYANMR